MHHRIFSWFILALLTLSAPWWVTIITGVICTLLFPAYLEFLLVGASIDLIYGVAPLNATDYNAWYYTLLATSCILIARLLKGKLHLYAITTTL